MAVEIEQASAALWQKFHAEPWFVAVGRGLAPTGQPCLVLYLKRRVPHMHELFGPKWMGHDLMIVISGPVGPAGPSAIGGGGRRR